jgi:hypothetical protein
LRGSIATAGVARALGARDGGVELGFRDPLEIEVNGEREVLARHGVLDAVGELLAGVYRDGVPVLVHEPAQGVHPAPLRHYPPEDVHVIHLPTGLPAQHLLVVELDPALPDDRVVLEALEGLLLELLLRDRAGVAESVGGHLPLRIVADVVVVHGDARKLRGALADVGDVVAVGVLFDEHRAVLVPQLEGRVVAIEYRLGVGLEDLGELLDLLPGCLPMALVNLVGDDRHVETGDVVREDLPVAVVDDTALGGVLDHAGLGRLGGERVLVAREDLQVPQPGRQDDEDHRDDDREGDHPHLHVALGYGRRVHALLGGPRLLLLGHREPDHWATFSAWMMSRRE